MVILFVYMFSNLNINPIVALQNTSLDSFSVRDVTLKVPHNSLQLPTNKFNTISKLIVNGRKTRHNSSDVAPRYMKRHEAIVILIQDIFVDDVPGPLSMKYPTNVAEKSKAAIDKNIKTPHIGRCFARSRMLLGNTDIKVLVVY